MSSRARRGERRVPSTPRLKRSILDSNPGELSGMPEPVSDSGLAAVADSQLASFRAFLNTSSIIFSVSLPVLVFWREG